LSNQRRFSMVRARSGLRLHLSTSAIF
jgi:hypothetical protein